MSLLDTKTLSDMRAVQGQAMPDTCTIKRPSVTYGGPSSSTEGETTVATGVACRIAPGLRTPDEEEIAEAVRGRMWWWVTLPHSQDVNRKDTITIGGVVYEVIGVASAGSWVTAKRVAVVGVTV